MSSINIHGDARLLQDAPRRKMKSWISSEENREAIYDALHPCHEHCPLALELARSRGLDAGGFEHLDAPKRRELATDFCRMVGTKVVETWATAPGKQEHVKEVAIMCRSPHRQEGALYRGLRFMKQGRAYSRFWIDKMASELCSTLKRLHGKHE